MDVQDVLAAQAGDTEAFGRLLAEHQDRALACARAWLRDPEEARDAAQDALLDAMLRLPQLRDPLAFPAWLRRVVVKHCDRRTRGGKRSVPLSVAPEGVGGDLEQAALHRDARAAVWAAVEALPEHQRVVVALHYLAEAPQDEVAALLGLPLSTVKKRLHDARARLRAREIDMQAHLQNTHDAPMSDAVRLFVALRAGEVEVVEALLDRHPEALEAPEQWSAEEALAGGLTLAHRLTPLTLAARRGHEGLVARLLARGAGVDGPCGCAEGETPLFAAVTHGRAAVTRRLLAAGADPSAANRAGVRPLDVARARGREDLVQALLQAGAEPGVQLSAWPEVRPLDDAGWVDTGIRGLDLLAPLRLGMRVRVHGAAETGLFALITELTFGLARRGLAPVWASLERRPWQRGELATVAAGAGLDEVEVVSDGVEAAVERARGRALFVFAEEGREAEVEARLGLLSRAGLAFVVDPWAAVTRGDKGAPTLGAPWDAVVVTDPALANAGVYPALDLARTGSTAVRSASQADLRDKLVAMGAEAPAVQAFLRQPFFTYQHHNAWPGEASSWAQTEAAARAAVG